MSNIAAAYLRDIRNATMIKDVNGNVAVLVRVGPNGHPVLIVPPQPAKIPDIPVYDPPPRGSTRIFPRALAYAGLFGAAIVVGDMIFRQPKPLGSVFPGWTKQAGDWFYPPDHEIPASYFSHQAWHLPISGQAISAHRKDAEFPDPNENVMSFWARNEELFANTGVQRFGNESFWTKTNHAEAVRAHAEAVANGHVSEITAIPMNEISWLPRRWPELFKPGTPSSPEPVPQWAKPPRRTGEQPGGGPRPSPEIQPDRRFIPVIGRVEVAPNAPPKISPKPGRHPLRPPNPLTRDGKVKTTALGVVGILLKTYGAATEYADAVDAIFKGLPAHLQKIKRPKGWLPLYELVRLNNLERSAAWRAEQIFKHMGNVDLVAAAHNLAMNHLQDEILGRSNSAANKALAKATGSPQLPASRTNPLGVQTAMEKKFKWDNFNKQRSAQRKAKTEARRKANALGKWSRESSYHRIGG